MSNPAAEFYAKRYDQFGDQVEALGWKNRQQQFYRFEVLTQNINLNGRTILDLGCGHGDFIMWMEQSDINYKSYLGLDVTKEFIDNARKKYQNNNKIEFMHADISAYECNNFDVIIASGSFSYKPFWSYNKTIETIKYYWSKSNILFSSNFLTTKIEYQLDRNLHFDPAQLLTDTLELTNRINIISGYLPKEFTLQMWRNNE